MASEYYLTLFIEEAYIKSSPKNIYLAPTKSLYTLYNMNYKIWFDNYDLIGKLVGFVVDGKPVNIVISQSMSIPANAVYCQYFTYISRCKN